MVFLLTLLISLAVMTLPVIPSSFRDEMGTSFPNAFLTYFLVAELILVIGRFTYNLVILPKNLTLFPVPKSKLFFTMTLVDLCDIKSLVYFIPVFIYLIHLVTINIFLSIYAFIIFVLFYFVLELLFLLVYLLFVKPINKYKNNLSIIYSTIIILLVINGSDHLETISAIPVLGWVGLGIEYLNQGILIPPILYTAGMSGLVIAEIFLGIVLIHKTQLIH